MSIQVLSEDEVAAAVAGLDAGWSGSSERLTRSIEFADFMTAVGFIDRLAPRCEERDHHPYLTLRWRWVDLELSTHSKKGVTELDVWLAGVIDEIAAQLPLAP